MSLISKIEHWGDIHHPKILDLIRMVLGGLMVAKGWSSMEKFPYIRDMILSGGQHQISSASISLILNCASFSYFLGGSLIFLGLKTRAASVMVLPVTILSIVFVNVLAPFMSADVWVNALVIALLFQFMVIGSGPLSLDNFTDHMKFGKNIK